MSIEQYDYERVIINILKGDPSEQDIEFFREWIKDEKNEELFDNVKKLWNASVLKRNLNVRDNEDDWSKLKYLAHIRRQKSRIGITRFAIGAAAIAGLIIILPMLFQKRGDQPKSTEIVATTDTGTKTDKSREITITLSDGRVVPLSELEEKSTDVKVDKEKLEITYNSAKKNNTIEYNTAYVPRGIHISILLSDGTKVWINADSRVAYPVHFPKDSRRVEVVGNAYFEIVPDASRPFTVVTGELKTIALGTEFEVENYDTDQTIVTLLKGSVKVSNKSQDVVITPGTQVIFHNYSENLEQKKIDGNLYGCWRNNVLVIDNEPIDVILEKLSRWHGVEIVNKANNIEDMLFTGKMSEGTVEDHLRIITKNANIKFRFESGRIIIEN
jgi:ferric-dicitrate binding protein FerR (iron transport regulator)